MRRLFIGLMLMGFAAHAQVRITQPAQLGAQVVTTPAIADGAVTAAKLASGVAAGSVTSVNVGTSVAGLSFTGGPITGTGTITFGVTDSALFRAAVGLTIGTNVAGLTGGLVPVANLGSGTASSSTYLRGDGTWATPSAGVTVPSTSAFLVGNGSGGVSAGTTTGILKASSGVVSAAVAADFPTLNQNTTGSAGSVAAANVTGSGTLPDAVLSSNVPLLNAANTFTANQKVSAFLGIGVTPTYALHVAPTSGDTAGQTAFFKGSTDTGVVIKAGSAQAANLLDVQNSSGVSLAKINASGLIYAASLNNTGGGTNSSIAPASTGAQINTGVAANVTLIVRNTATTPTGNLTNWQAASTLVAYVNAGGDVVVTDATKGTVRRSPNGHYWRTTVGDTGTLTTTDLGTTAP